MKRLFFLRSLVLLLVLSLGLAQPLLAADDGGLFSKLKAKAAEKASQLKDKDWWTVKIGGSAAAFVGGKTAGLAGAAVGGALGLMAGPAGMAAGALIGYRLASITGGVFTRQIGKDLTRQKLAGEDLSWSDVKDAWKRQDKKALAVEAGASIVGDFLGELVGVSIGVALLGGMGPIALPIIGVVTGAYLGKKLGRWLGSKFGRYISRKTIMTAYSALTRNESAAAPMPPGVPAAGANVSTPTTAALKNSVFSSTSGFTEAQMQMKTVYEAAYQRYVHAQQDTSISDAERQKLLSTYLSALDALHRSLGR